MSLQETSELSYVGAFRVYGSVRKTGSRVRLCKRHWPYGACTTLFAWSLTIHVRQSGRPERNNGKAEGN